MLLQILKGYLAGCTAPPKVYVFEGQEPGKPYSARSVQKVFQLARGKAGIGKHVTFHCLRHSFATHLLEKGTDIHYIKQLLGHFDIRTTERYLHVTNNKLLNIASPLDDLWKKGNIEW